MKNTKEYFILAKKGDEQARKILIEYNLRIVHQTIKNYFPLVTIEYPEIEMEDLINTGVIGLIKAVENFKLEKNCDFYRYATTCIKNEILMLLRKTKKDVETLSINNPVTFENSSDELCLKDFLKSDALLEEDYIKKEANGIIRESLNILTPIEKTVIELYYGFNKEPLNYREIGNILGYSHCYIGKVELNARNKLTMFFEKMGLRTNKKYSREISDLKLTKPRDIALFFVNKIINANVTIEQLAQGSIYNACSIKKRITAIVPRLDNETKAKLSGILKEQNSKSTKEQQFSKNKLEIEKVLSRLFPDYNLNTIYEAVEELSDIEKGIFLGRFPKDLSLGKSYLAISVDYDIKIGEIHIYMNEIIKKIITILESHKRSKEPEEMPDISKPNFDYREHKDELKFLINTLESKIDRTILLLRLGLVDDIVYGEEEIGFFLEMDSIDIHKTIEDSLKKILSDSKYSLKTEEYLSRKLTLAKEN